MFKILVVEDNVKMRNELKTFLENNGYEVSYVTDFINVKDFIINSKFDMILLDLNLPNINGEFICKEVRKESSVPIIVVTSKNTDIDELISINYGADDFITKPYNPQILLARIERILKRNNSTLNILTYEDLTLDISKSILYNDKDKLELSKNEIKILIYLLKNRGRIVLRDDLINYLWDSYDFVDDNTLTVNINRLRSKLDDLGYKDVINTRRGQGYIIL